VPIGSRCTPFLAPTLSFARRKVSIGHEVPESWVGPSLCPRMYSREGQSVLHRARSLQIVVGPKEAAGQRTRHKRKKYMQSSIRSKATSIVKTHQPKVAKSFATIPLDQRVNILLADALLTK
jgi:hypothetical protein